MRADPSGERRGDAREFEIELGVLDRRLAVSIAARALR